MNVADILEEAADRIDKHGWWRMGDLPKSGRLATCAANAICWDKNFHMWNPAIEALTTFLGGRPGQMEVIWKWNDTPGRTKEEVTSTMRAAAAVWRAKQGPSSTEAAPVNSERSLLDKVAV